MGFGCEFYGDSHVFDDESQFTPAYHPLYRTDWGDSSHSFMPSSIWPPLPENTLGLFAQKLKRSSNAGARPKRLWIRCTRSTVSSRSCSERLRCEIVSAAPSCVCFTLTETVLMMRVSKKDYTSRMAPVSARNYSRCQPYTSTSRPGNVRKPERVEGFRFAKMRLQQDSKRYDIVATSPKFLPFGYGRRACPGRYFAACKLKNMLAHTVLNDDVKMENDGVRPADVWLASSCIPDLKGKVMFCKRAR